MSERGKSPRKKTITDFGVFEFANGDVYNGQFQLSDDHKITRNGIGLYETCDGESYYCIWKSDSPIDKITISFLDSCKYKGNVLLPLMLYNSEEGGFYRFPDGSEITCSWLNGYPNGGVHLLDPRGYKWYGIFYEMYSKAVLIPKNYLVPKHGYRWTKLKKTRITITIPENKLDKNRNELLTFAKESMKKISPPIFNS